MTRMDIPSSTIGKLKKLPELSKMGGAFPKLEKSGPVTFLTEDEPSFSKIPILKSWPNDAGKFITLGLVATKHPETKVRNLGVYRIQILDDTHALMHWQKHKRGAQHAQMNKGKTEVAIIIGADPATVFSAIAPVPEGLDKYLFAGITRKSGIKMVKCKTVDLEVPANAEIILEGYVDSNDMRPEGPFGDHTGYYTPVEPYPVFTLTGMMRLEKRYILPLVVHDWIQNSFLPLSICSCSHGPNYIVHIVNIYALINYDDRLCKCKLTRPPHSHHYFFGLSWIFFTN